MSKQKQLIRGPSVMLQRCRRPCGWGTIVKWTPLIRHDIERLRNVWTVSLSSIKTCFYLLRDQFPAWTGKSSVFAFFFSHSQVTNLNLFGAQAVRVCLPRLKSPELLLIIIEPLIALLTTAWLIRRCLWQSDRPGSSPVFFFKCSRLNCLSESDWSWSLRITPFRCASHGRREVSQLSRRPCWLQIRENRSCSTG